MKQLFPAFSLTKKVKIIADPKRVNYLKRYFFLTLIPVLTLFISNTGHAQINDNGLIHKVDYSGGVQDFVIPMNPSIAKISFELKGGDGGYARVADEIPVFGDDVVCFSTGGSGATTIATFSVGNGFGKIPHGSIIRFIVGGKGASGSSGGIVGNGLDYGGGGGGTAVLYLPPASSNWIILGVAGGGGGAYSGMALYICVDRENGQGGRSGTSGGSGNGDLDPGGAGVGGFGGDGNEIGGAGGGAFGAGGGPTCVGIPDFNTNVVGEGGPGNSGSSYLGGYGGTSSGCFAGLSWRNGGYGFGGGGAGVGAGGGGGGYSGGGSGGTTGRGGGGGSYLNPNAESSVIESGGTVFIPSDGFAKYRVTLNPPPVAICRNINVNLLANGTASITPAMINNGSFDREGESLTYKFTNELLLIRFNCSNVGPNQVTLIVTDQAGLTDECTATVTVSDVTPPNVIAQNISVDLDPTGNATITAAMIDNGSADACGIETYELNIYAFDCSDVGENTVILTVTDVNGNEASAPATVTVNDVTPPNVITQNITVELDANGEATITAAMIDNGSTDACGIASYELDIYAFDCSDVGENTVILTVTDVNGNEASAPATVTVEDNIAPTIVSVTPSPSTLWAPNHKMVDIEVSIESFDNCPGHTCEIISVTSNEPLNSIGDGNTEVDYLITGTHTVKLRAERNGKGEGRIYTITVKCTDASGNASEATTVVTVAHDRSKLITKSIPEESQDNTLSMEVINNPSGMGQPFGVRILSNDKQTPIQLRMMDATGKPVETRNGMMPDQVISFGHQYRQGIYFVEAMQGAQRKTMKLMKL